MKRFYQIGGQVLMGVFLTGLIHSGAGAFCFDEAAKEYAINPALLRSIAQVESGLNPRAMNSNSNGTVDMGVMQINSSWIAPLHLDRDALTENPCYNVMTGARILKDCINRHGYTWEAVGCYNAHSHGKRVHYSWKIHDQLRREGLTHKKLSKRDRPVLEANNFKKESSLSIHTRDTTEDVPIIPDHR